MSKFWATRAERWAERGLAHEQAAGGWRAVLTAYARSHQGLVRSENQDGYVVEPLPDGAWLLAVADGMGGLPGGAVASRRVLDVVRRLAGGRRHGAAELEQAVKAANRDLFREGRQRPDLRGMGTTVTVAQVAGTELIVAHVGDSRAYRLRGGRLERLTQDHSVAAELEAAGEISRDEAAVHPQRHVLTRAVGPWHTVRVDLLVVPWHRADRLLLCTDGLTGVVSDAEILAILAQARGEGAVAALVDAALARGGPDNVTVVLAEDDEEAGGHGR